MSTTKIDGAVHIAQWTIDKDQFIQLQSGSESFGYLAWVGGNPMDATVNLSPEILGVAVGTDGHSLALDCRESVLVVIFPARHVLVVVPGEKGSLLGGNGDEPLRTLDFESLRAELRGPMKGRPLRRVLAHNVPADDSLPGYHYRINLF